MVKDWKRKKPKGCPEFATQGKVVNKAEDFLQKANRLPEIFFLLSSANPELQTQDSTQLLIYIDQ